MRVGIVTKLRGAAAYGPLGLVAILVQRNVCINPALPPNVDLPALGQRSETLTIQQPSIEYGSCNDHYLQFLLDELLPFVTREMNFRVTDEPADRTICAIFNDGICAFNTASNGILVAGYQPLRLFHKYSAR